MKSNMVPALLAAALVIAPGIAAAQQLAYAAKDLNLRAGPERDYPVVAIVRNGEALTVAGCLPDYRWCDVIAGAGRGWVYAGNIVYPYQGNTVPVLSYGAMLGIGIVSFSLGAYWDQHYQTSPWYPQQPYWIARPRPMFRPGLRPLPPPGPGLRRAPVPGFRPPPGVRPPAPPARVPGVLQRPRQTQSPGPNQNPAPPRTRGPGGGGGQRPGAERAPGGAHQR